MEIDDQASSSAIVRDADGCSIFLALDNRDDLFAKKKKLLERQGFESEKHVYLKNSLSSEEVKAVLEELIPMARIIQLNENEIYFGEDECTPVESYSPRNELAALNFIFSLVHNSISSCKPSEFDVLQKLRKAVVNMIHDLGDEDSKKAKIVVEYRGVEENRLVQWGESHGVRTSLQIAYVAGDGRGAIAKEDLDVGDTALEIPLSIIISEELVYKTNMYPILSDIDGMSSETMLLIWSMKEKHIAKSKFRFYFDTLPLVFNTGLSFGVGAMTILDGTLLLDEIMQAKEHLREQYNAIFPALCDNHPDVFPAEFYSWEQFLWACELWYSNSLKIMFADGSLQTCLVPIAGFLNHSLYPHIISYGKVDKVSNSLKFRLARPCHAGEQCYLSYGNYSSSHLITFYGFFLPERDNLNDIIPLEIDSGDGHSISSEWSTHMLRGTWLSKNECVLFHYGLPSPLLDCFRKARFSELYSKCKLQGSLEKEMEVLVDIYSIFKGMMENFEDEKDRRKTDWDIQLARKYKDLQKLIVSSVLTACSCGHKLLKTELYSCMQEDIRG